MSSDADKPAGGSDLPPLNLSADGSDSRPGGYGPDEGRGASGSDWRRRALTGALVALAVVVTAIVTDLRDSAREEAAAAEEVNLVLGGFEDDRLAVTPSGSIASRIHVFNAGKRDVDVVSLYPTGWRDVAEDFRARTLPAGVWVAVPVRAEPPCDGSARIPRTFEAVVRTDGGERTVTLPLYSTNTSELTLNAGILCSRPAQTLFNVGELDIGELALGEVDADTLPMRLLVMVDTDAIRVAGTVRITGIDTTAQGFAVEMPEQPVEVPLGGEANVDIAWRVADCRQAQSLTEAEIRLGHDVNPPLLVTSQPQELSAEAIAALGRLADGVCG